MAIFEASVGFTGGLAMMIEPPATTMQIHRSVLVALCVMALSLLGCGRGDVEFDQGVRLVEATLPRQVSPRDEAALTLRFQPSRPLRGNWWVFLHLEAAQAAGANCRVVQDRAPTPPVQAWGAQSVTHAVTLQMPDTCRPGRLDLFAGIYERDLGDRLAVRHPRAGDNRVLVGSIDVVAANPDHSPRTITGGDIRGSEYTALLTPWKKYLGLLAVAALGAYFLWRRSRSHPADEPAEEKLPLWARRSGLLIPAVAYVLGVMVVLEFIKDDAYISFRYANNLVHGRGLVFNEGERLEGITNFLWTILMVPFEALGWDLFQVCEVLGTGLTLVLLGHMVWMSVHLRGERRDLSHLWSATWIATCGSLVLWSKSGMEQPLSTLLPFAGAVLLWKTPPEESDRSPRRHLFAGLMLGAASGTRPEIHLVAAILGVPLLFDAIRARRLTAEVKMYSLGVLAVVVPLHLFRYGYYGSLLPNTFYVKTGTGDMIWRAGLNSLNDMFTFNHIGWMVGFVPFAFSSPTHRRERVTMLAVALAFMGFVVKVGNDEMHWHRLYLPALPFLVALSLEGMRAAGEGFARLAKLPKVLVSIGGWAIIAGSAWDHSNLTYQVHQGFNGHGDLSGMYHPDIGKFITRHERPGGTAAFQDMGSTPYHAPDIRFLDFIGLVDRTVAHARHAHGLHAFVPSGGGREQTLFDREMRDYFFRRDPEWAVLTVYPPQHLQDQIARDFPGNPGPGSIGDSYRSNPYQFGIWDDPRFRDGYVHVRTWPRSRSYYLSLFRRRDLWERTPREVVLDAPPANIGGARVRFSNGVELLGSEVQRRTLQRHEVFITTWWRVPGPFSEDTTFFVHINRGPYQTTMDHVPGDWMYPANRWRAGDIIEDRVLFQVPIEMNPGDYNVHIGVYQRSSGQRFHVTSGPSDGSDRIPLGSFRVERLLPFVHQLIPPTRVEQMRRHPERIMQGGPRRGTEGGR